jgi:AraC-like DNA-binding protein
MGHPLAFAAFLEHVGAPADRLLRRRGLAVYCDDPDDFVPVRQAWSFFDDVARSEDPTVGWHVGRFVGDHGLSRRFLRKLEGAPTLYAALKRFARLSSSEASHVHLGIVERKHDILFFTHYPSMKGVPGYELSQSYQLGIILDLLRHFLGRSWVPKEIGIEYPSVPRVAEEHFPGSRILAQQRIGYVTVPRSCLYVPARCGDPVADGGDSLVLTEKFDYAQTLGTLLHAYLPGGYPSARLAASLVDTSVRTLARRLADSGTTYRSVVDRVRFKAARELLQNTDLRVTDVAMAVGFDDSANFARMFRRIGGLSPRQFRRAIHQV